MADVIKKENVDRVIAATDSLINELMEFKGDLASHDRSQLLPEALGKKVAILEKLRGIWLYPDMM